MSTEIQVLGAGQDVGKSAVLVSENNHSVVLDYGTKIYPIPPQYPPICKPDAAIISHAHLDHCGAAPALLRGKEIPIFMTNVTHELSELLIEDSLKIATTEQYPIPFGKKQIKKFNQVSRLVSYRQPFIAGRFSCQFYDAGHIPGSAGVLMQGKKIIFYTGDVQTERSRLLDGCVLPRSADALIIESTYGQKKHPDRQKEEERFLNAVQEALDNGGKVIVPVFAVGRSQEMLMILERYASSIAVDGMVRSATDIILKHPEYVRDKQRLAAIVKKTHVVQRGAQRKDVYKRYKIILASAGMLTGGPVRYYAEEAIGKEENKILFPGYLVDESPGKMVLDKRKFPKENELLDVVCDVQQFDFSAHADRKGLFSIIRKMQPQKVICMHGDMCKKFAQDIEKEFGIPAFAPKDGDTIRV